MDYEIEPECRELGGEELDAAVGGTETRAMYDLKPLKKVAEPETYPGIIAIL